MDNYTKDSPRGVRLQAPICQRQVGSELIGDLSLPDYLPEIKRLLRVKATVSPADSYVGVGNAEFTGAVDYTVLYAAQDGSLYSASQTEEYRFEVPVEITSEFELGEGLVCDVETVAEAVMGRVSSPRRLSLRTKLRSDVRIFGTRLMEEHIDTVNPTSLQRLHGEATCAQLFCGVGEAFALQDEILLDSQSADLRVICADGAVFVAEANAGSDCVTSRGEVVLKLLCAHEDGAPISIQRKIPFSHTVPLDGCEVNCECAAHGVCTDLNITVEEGRILCDVSVRLRVRAQRNVLLPYTRDLYSTEAEGENKYTEPTLMQALRCVNGNFSLNSTLSMEEAGMKSGMSVLDCQLTSGFLTPELCGKKLYLNGKCRCHLILSDKEELSAQEPEISFRYELDSYGEEGMDVADCIATADVLSCRARVDGQRIFIDAELGICATLRGEQKIRMLSDATFGRAVSRQASVYTVCYPSRDDSLWSVSKRYHRPIETVAELNTLSGAASADSPDSLAGVVYLLV